MITGLELLRLTRSRRPLIAILAIVFYLGLMLLGFYTYAQTQSRGDVEFRYTFENRSYFNGLTFALYAFYFGSLLILPIFVATEGGAQIAGDSASGRIYLYLTRPLSRTRLFFTKVALMFGFATLLVGVLTLFSLTTGLLFVGWGDLHLYPGVLQMSHSHQHLTQTQALLAFLYAWPAASIALMTPLAFSILISAWSRSAVNAVGTSVAAYMILYVMAEVQFFDELRPWFFTSYMSYWRGIFNEQVDWAPILRDGGRLLGFSCLFLGLAFHRFRNREEL